MLSAIVLLTSLRALPGTDVEVVLVPLEGHGDASLRASFADDLRTAIDALPGYAAQKRATTAQHLTAAATLGIDCARDKPECLIKLGGLAGGAIVIGGSMTPAGTVELRAFDVRSGDARGGVTTGVTDARARSARLVAARLLAPERERGTVRVLVKPVGAAIFLDGVSHGTAPLPDPISVRAGKHEIYVARTGFESATHVVDVAFEGAAKLEVVLAPAADAVAVAPSAATPPSPERATGRRAMVLVLELANNGVTPEVARAVSAVVTAELARYREVEVVSGADVRRLADLEAERQALGCESDGACMAELAGALGADYVAFGEIGMLGSRLAIQVGLFDPREARPVARASVYATRLDDVPEALRPVIGDLIAPVLTDRGLAGAAPAPAQRESALWATSSLVGGAALLAIGLVLAGVGAATYPDGGELARLAADVADAERRFSDGDVAALDDARAAQHDAEALTAGWRSFGAAAAYAGAGTAFAGAVAAGTGALLLFMDGDDEAAEAAQ